jgi:hypothetical protein
VLHAAHVVLRKQNAITDFKASASTPAVRVPADFHDLVAGDFVDARGIVEALLELLDPTLQPFDLGLCRAGPGLGALVVSLTPPPLMRRRDCAVPLPVRLS